MTMTRLLHHSIADPSVGLPATDELVKRILKLRWIGCGEEAERLLRIIGRVSGSPIICAMERETD